MNFFYCCLSTNMSSQFSSHFVCPGLGLFSSVVRQFGLTNNSLARLY